MVAATNKDLREEVARGRFRDDLYFRLAVIRFDLPFLSERREDIPLLVDHFIRRFNARSGKNILGVSPEVMDLLMRHDFPGNVRELENVIEFGFAVCHGRTLETDHLPLEFKISTRLEASEESAMPAGSGGASVLESMDEEQRIRYLLKENRGRRDLTAIDLGIERTTLWRKMKKYGIGS